MSLREALEDAESLAHLAEPDPAVEVALLRLLVAVVHASALRDTERGEDLEEYPVSAISSYLDQQEQNFDLFDPQRPFLQNPDAAALKQKSPVGLLAPFAPGSGSKVFPETKGIPCHDDDLSAEDAARALLRLLAWGSGQTASGVLPEVSEHGSTPAGPLAGALVAVPLGRSLAETLVLNSSTLYESGTPAWEAPFSSPPSGWLGRLVWPSRSYLLVPDESGERVVGIHFGPGFRQDADEVSRDPNLVWTASGAFMRGSADRVLYRETPTIFGWLEGKESPVGSPAIQAASDHLLFTDGSQLGTVLLVSQDNVLMTPASTQRREWLPLPARLIGPSARASLVSSELAAVEKVASGLRYAWQAISERKTTVIPSVAPLWAEIESDYLLLIEDVARLGDDSSQVDEFVQNFRHRIHAVAKRLYHSEALAFPADRYAEGLRRLNRELNKQVPLRKEQS